MALVNKIASDIHAVFINHEHFASWHTWNGRSFQCVTDEDMALKRKNNNVVDLSWDNNSSDTLIYVDEKEFPGRAMPNEQGFFDKKPMKILQVNRDGGMISIVMASFDAKAVANK